MANRWSRLPSPATRWGRQSCLQPAFSRLREPAVASDSEARTWSALRVGARHGSGSGCPPAGAPTVRSREEIDCYRFSPANADEGSGLIRVHRRLSAANRFSSQLLREGLRQAYPLRSDSHDRAALEQFDPFHVAHPLRAGHVPSTQNLCPMPHTLCQPGTLRKWWGGPPGPRGTPSSRVPANRITLLRSPTGRRGRRSRTMGSAPPLIQPAQFRAACVALARACTPPSEWRVSCPEVESHA